MTVYIEYVFAENFLLDGVLLYLSLKAIHQKIYWKRLALGSAFGGIFSVVFPLLTLPIWAALVCKLCTGFLLCFFAFGRIKTKKEWGRYALNAIFFFLFTFAFGGTLMGIGGSFPEKASPAFVFGGFVFLTCVLIELIKKVYQKRAVENFVYPCKVLFRGKGAAASGFYDSGNFAIHNNLPVCFLSPDLAFDVFGEELFAAGGMEIAKTKIKTMSGEKTLRLFKGEIEIKTAEKTINREVYFAFSGNMLSREYKLILHSRIFEEQGERG